MSRSQKVAPQHIERVKQARKRCGFPSVQAFATEMGRAYATASKFFNGKEVDFINFVEFSEKLGLDWQEITNAEELAASTPILNEAQGQSIYVAKMPSENASNQGIDSSRFIGREAELTKLHQHTTQIAKPQQIMDIGLSAIPSQNLNINERNAKILSSCQEKLCQLKADLYKVHGSAANGTVNIYREVILKFINDISEAEALINDTLKE